MLLSRDAIFHENSFGNRENVTEKVIIDQQLLAERQKADNIMHFSYKDTETVNEGVQEHTIGDNGTGDNQTVDIPRRSLREIVAPDRLGVIVGDWWNEPKRRPLITKT